MKKTIIILGLLVFNVKLMAQFITTSAPNVPINFSRDLNFTTEATITANSVPVLRSMSSTNLGVGINAGNPALAAGENTWVGAFAGNASTGIGNLAMGSGALRTSSAGYTTALGYYSGANSSGQNNSFVGNASGRYNTASNAVGFGYQSGINNQGNNSILVGFLAGENNKGENNIAIGIYSGQKSNVVGANNIFVGTYSGINNTDGGGNTFVGYGTGQNNTTGSNNTFLGNSTGVSVANAGLTNATAIGFNTTVAASNALILGNSANVGIGISAPAAKLHVVGGNSVATGVRFQNLPNDAAGGSATQYVVIDVDGNLFRYTGAAPARQGVVENAGGVLPNSFNENWTLKNDFLYNKNKKGIIIGEGIASLPKGYGMYVTDGILTEKVKVAIKNSSDWADYVFNKDYKKMTLTQVEKFISVNKHLPNMPSAAEMVAEGNDLAKTDAKLLEKIEELTLYMIEMKKENAQMKSQIKSLKRKLK
jgi:trimeric autotransporter adhesin